MATTPVTSQPVTSQPVTSQPVTNQREKETRASAGEPDAPARRADPSPGAETDDLDRRIEALRAELDRLVRERGAKAEGAPRAAATPYVAAEPRRGEATARELLASPYYERHWGQAGRRSRAEEVDEFGLDPNVEARFRPMLDRLYRRYFRVETAGAENIPNEGPCLVVCNHGGGPLPLDGLLLRTAVRLDHPTHRELRWLAEDFVYYLPFVGVFMNRLGAVRACQENAERLLAGGRAVAVFPEGVKGLGKLYRDRYRLQRFGRGGFIRLCLRTRTPIVPCAVVGAEEANPMLYRVDSVAKSLGIPYLPITPTFPALGPLGLLPAPTKWSIRFGEAMRFDDVGPEGADDDVLVGKLAERVRGTIQDMLDQALAARKSLWFG